MVTVVLIQSNMGMDITAATVWANLSDDGAPVSHPNFSNRGNFKILRTWRIPLSGRTQSSFSKSVSISLLDADERPTEITFEGETAIGVNLTKGGYWVLAISDFNPTAVVDAPLFYIGSRIYSID